MATQHITVNGVAASDGGFSPSSNSDIISRASDGDTGTSFQNTSGNQSITFELEGVSDYSDLSGATITSVQAIITVAASGKGSASFTVRLKSGTSDDAAVYQSDDLGTENASQTDVEGTTANNGGSGFSADELNGLHIEVAGTEGALNIISRVRVLVTFTAAANPFISKISGLVIGSVNKVSSLAKTSMAKVIAVVNYFDRSAVAKSISTGTSEAVYISDSNGSYRVDHNDAFSVSFWIKVGWNVSMNSTFHMFASADVGAAGANADVFRIWYYEPHNRIYAEWRSGSSEKKHNFWFFHENSSNNNNSADAFNAAGLGTTFWNSSNRGNANSDGYTLITVTRGTTNSAASSNLNLYWNATSCGVGFYASGGGSGTPNMGNSTDKQIALGSNAWSFTNCGNNTETKFNGVTVWDKKLTSSEVTELYNSGTPMDVSTHSAYANCTGWWNFEDTNGTNLISGGPDFDQINGNSNIGPI